MFVSRVLWERGARIELLVLSTTLHYTVYLRSVGLQGVRSVFPSSPDNGCPLGDGECCEARVQGPVQWCCPGVGTYRRGGILRGLFSTEKKPYFKLVENVPSGTLCSAGDSLAFVPQDTN